MQKKHLTKSNTLEHGNTHQMRAGVICREHVALGDGRTKAFPFRSGASQGQRLPRRPRHPEPELLLGRSRTKQEPSRLGSRRATTSIRRGHDLDRSRETPRCLQTGKRPLEPLTESPRPRGPRGCTRRLCLHQQRAFGKQKPDGDCAYTIKSLSGINQTRDASDSDA